jgi:hypothetical protein
MRLEHQRPFTGDDGTIERFQLEQDLSQPSPSPLMARCRRHCSPKGNACIIQQTLLLSLTTSPEPTGRLESETADLLGVLEALPQRGGISLQPDQGFKGMFRLLTQTKLERHASKPTVGFDATRIRFDGRSKVIKGRFCISERVRLMSQPIRLRGDSSRVYRSAPQINLKIRGCRRPVFYFPTPSLNSLNLTHFTVLCRIHASHPPSPVHTNSEFSLVFCADLWLS